MGHLANISTNLTNPLTKNVANHEKIKCVSGYSVPKEKCR